MQKDNKQVFLILSCARSGSTSLTKILDTAKNGICALEPMPNLNRETRDMMEGRVADPMAVLEEYVIPRIRKKLNEVEVYGEKNVTYGPFISYIYKALKCKFIFIKRDGRDVVTSLINWHEQKFGTIYRECNDPGNISPVALSSAANLPVHLDTSDYSRPRPLKGDPLYLEWENMKRVEMCAFYWSYINDLYVNELKKLPKDAWMEIDYSTATVGDVLRVAEFCGLKGLKSKDVQAMLDQKINSLEYRDSLSGTYPDWKNWDGEMRRPFDRIAYKTMYRLGYYKHEGSEWHPVDYGNWWREHDGGIDWYTWMYNGRLKMHQSLVRWVSRRNKNGDEILSIADFGCGLGVGYCDDFSSLHYIGVDLSIKNIQWCKENRKNEEHEYLCIDFVTENLKRRVDLVFSSGTVDNTYDVDAFIRAMVRNSRKWIYLTLYRGWFPYLTEHVYSYDEGTTCFYNDISPVKVWMLLESLGCTDIDISPIATSNKEIPFETKIIARVPYVD